MAQARRPGGARAIRRESGQTVGALLAALDQFCPFSLAPEWDNVGLIAGDPTWPARRALLAIDLTDAVAAEVLDGPFDTAIIYHPPIFKGTRNVTAAAESSTTRLADLLAARVSIIALHTALDAAIGGTNDVLLDLFRPSARRPLEPVTSATSAFKLTVFVPAAEVTALRAALAAAGAGQIGNYTECSFELAGRGSFRGNESTSPTIGQRGRLETVAESRLEMVVPANRLGEVVRTLYATHSYEEPAFDLTPLTEFAGRGQVGLGRVGQLAKPTPGRALIAALRKGGVDLSAAQQVGDLKRRFASVTVAAGSFSSRSFRDPGTLVITGELKHHDALDLLRRGITAVCLGHYASERPVLAVVQARLRASLARMQVRISNRDCAPLRPLV